jgi:hypothetical protein
VFAVYGAVSCRVPGFSAWVALAPPPALHPAAGADCGCSSTARAMVASCAGRPHPRFLPRLRLHWEAVQDIVRRGGGSSVLDGLALTTIARTGAKSSSCAPVQPLPTVVEVITAPGRADVVASAGEATHCRGGCLRWRDRQCHLLPVLRLFGFNGLAVTPHRRTGARSYSQQRLP